MHTTVRDVLGTIRHLCDRSAPPLNPPVRLDIPAIDTNICRIKMPRRTRRQPVQQALEFRTHGGARAGAGRKKDRARNLMSHDRRPEFSSAHPVHVTLRVRPEVWNLRSRRSFKYLARSLSSVAGSGDVRVVQYSVQGNHLHLVVEASDRRALSRRMQGFAIRTAKGLNRMMGRRGRVFADRYHARVLRTPLEVHRVLAYVLRNHTKHFGANTPVVDGYSSAPYFDGWRRQAPEVEAIGPPPSAPRTWLLRVGWRRRGLLDASPSRID